MATLKSRRRIALLSIAGVLLIQIAGWLVTGRQSLEGTAWAFYFLRTVPEIRDEYMPPCFEVEEALFESTPRSLLDDVLETADQLGITIAPVPFDPKRTQLEGECTFIWAPGPGESPAGSNDFNTPLLGRVTVGFFHYDSNGSAVLVASIFGKWFYVGSWGVWY